MAADAADDCSVSVLRANVLAVVVVPVAALLSFLPLALAWGGEEVARGWELAGDHVVIFIVALLGATLAHELLHLLGFLVGGAPRSSLRLGVHLRVLTPYASCSEPLTVEAYRFGAALPGLVLGVVPVLLAWALGSGALAVFAFLMLTGAGGDAIVIWLTRHLPAGTLVVDHPNRVGCAVRALPTAAVELAGD